MKQRVLQLAFSGLAASLFLLTAQPSFATVSGELVTGGTGTLTISETSLTFTPNDHGFSTEVGAATTLAFAGCDGTLGDPGCLVQGQGVDVNEGMAITNLNPIADFLTFNGTPSLVYSLTSYDPGSSNTTCAGLAVGASCSVFAGSPVILTNWGTFTTASLGVEGNVTDGSGTQPWSGSFSATVNHKTPAQLQATILTGGTIKNAHSGDFTVSMASTPEPRLISLAVLGAFFLAFVVQRRRKEA